jgi:hypothetical protein
MMGKKIKPGTVAFATASGFAVVHSPDCQSGEETPAVAKSRPKSIPDNFPRTEELETAEAS